MISTILAKTFCELYRLNLKKEKEKQINILYIFGTRSWPSICDEHGPCPEHSQQHQNVLQIDGHFDPRSNTRSNQTIAVSNLNYENSMIHETLTKSTWIWQNSWHETDIHFYMIPQSTVGYAPHSVHPTAFRICNICKTIVQRRKTFSHNVGSSW